MYSDILFNTSCFELVTDRNGCSEAECLNLRKVGREATNVPHKRELLEATIFPDTYRIHNKVSLVEALRPQNPVPASECGFASQRLGLIPL